jgi:hypothetical protein
LRQKQNSRIKADWDLAAEYGGFVVIEVPALQLFSPSGWLFLSDSLYRIFRLAETHRSRQIEGKLSGSGHKCSFSWA